MDDLSFALSPFRPLPDPELERLDDDELIAHLRAASDAGDRAQARKALQILVWGHYDLVAARLSLRLPAHVVEDQAADVIVRAITSSFAGESVGQFRAWLTTIMKRAVADYYAKAARRLPEMPLEPAGDDRPGPEPWSPDDSGYVEVQLIIQTCLEELSEPHRRVIEVVVLEGRPAEDAEREVDGMSAANAYQIASRFRKRLRDLLEEDNR